MLDETKLLKSLEGVSEKELNRMIVIDISPFDEPNAMSEGVNQVLDHEKIGQVILTGQSASGEFKFPKGFKHVAPQIHRDEFHSRIQSFIDSLNKPASSQGGSRVYHHQ